MAAPMMPVPRTLTVNSSVMGPSSPTVGPCRTGRTGLPPAVCRGVRRSGSGPSRCSSRPRSALLVVHRGEPAWLVDVQVVRALAVFVQVRAAEQTHVVHRRRATGAVGVRRRPGSSRAHHPTSSRPGPRRWTGTGLSRTGPGTGSRAGGSSGPPPVRGSSGGCCRPTSRPRPPARPAVQRGVAGAEVAGLDDQPAGPAGVRERRADGRIGGVEVHSGPQRRRAPRTAGTVRPGDVVPRIHWYAMSPHTLRRLPSGSTVHPPSRA